MKRIVIVGGGPAGSIAALCMARSGLSVTVLEKSGFPRNKPCGEFVNPMGVRILANAGLLPELMDAGACHIDRVAIVLPSGRFHTVPFTDTSTDGNATFGLTLPRSVLDSLCLKAAEAAGAEVRFRCRVHHIEKSCGGAGRWKITGRFLPSLNEQLTLEADLLIGADGVGSVVGRRLGWLERSWPERIGITADMSGFPIEPGLIEMHLLPGLYCGVVGRSDGTAHVGMAFDFQKGDWPMGTTPRDLLRSRMDQFPGLRSRQRKAEVVEPVLAMGPMSVRSRRIVGEGVMLIGDAAGFLDPITGHGISFAMRTAQLAADTALHAETSGDFSTRYLTAYATCYRRDLRRSQRLYLILQRALSLPNPFLMLLSQWFDAHPRWLKRIAQASLRNSPLSQPPLHSTNGLQ